MCNCRNLPIGDYYNEENLHINWHNQKAKSLDTAPEWATALVLADYGGHRQTYWVDKKESPTMCNNKGRSCKKPIDITFDDFEVVHVWQELK